MEPNDKKRLINCLMVMGETFQVKVTDLTVKAYSIALSELSIEQIESACTKAIVSSKFFPRPFDIRELAGVISPEGRAVIAFAVVSKTASQIGSDGSPDFDDAVVNATIRHLGGWVRICGIEAEEFEKWFSKEFQRVYVTLCQAGITPEMSAPLVGEHENHNRLMGYLIGNTLKLADGTEREWKPKLVATGLPDHTDKRLKPMRIANGKNNSHAIPKLELRKP
jgi:hypothetical protein